MKLEVNCHTVPLSEYVLFRALQVAERPIVSVGSCTDDIFQVCSQHTIWVLGWPPLEHGSSGCLVELVAVPHRHDLQHAVLGVEIKHACRTGTFVDSILYGHSLTEPTVDVVDHIMSGELFWVFGT